MDYDKTNIDLIKLQKMAFLFNAIEDGWTIKKHDNHYVFTKKHLGQKEIFLENYLEQFTKANLDLNSILNS